MERQIQKVAVVTAMLLGAAAWATQSRVPIDVATLGPQVGEQVPDFSLPDQHGRVWTRDELLGPNGAILMFHRSADW